MNKQEFIEQHIEDALLKGRWKLFQRLPAERRLAEEFGANRGTVRSALRSLAGRGILEIKRGSGSIVRSLPSPQFGKGTPHDCLQAFRLFIPVLAASCVLSASPSGLSRLEHILPTAGAAIRDGNMEAFIREQIRFFAEFIRLPRNPCLAQAAAKVLPGARLLTRLLRGTSLADCEPLFANMARLVNAVRYQDGEGARQSVLSYADALDRLLGAG